MYLYLEFLSFFHGAGYGSRIFRIGSGFSADPDPDSEKKSEPDKRTRIRNTDYNCSLLLLKNPTVKYF